MARRAELAVKKIAFRELEKEVAVTKRELIPLTTGMVVHVKKARSKRLRDMVRKKRKMATRLQALWRGAITRVAFKDPVRDYWIECFDEEQGEVTNEKIYLAPPFLHAHIHILIYYVTTCFFLSFFLFVCSVVWLFDLSNCSFTHSL